jgi:hypothetical protein
VGERPHVTTEVLRIRDRDALSLPGMPASTTAVNTSGATPPPWALPGVDPYSGVADSLLRGAEMRRTVEPIDGVHAVWCRLRVPVVAGEPIPATSRAALSLDLVNLLGVDLDSRRATSINPDVSAHLPRGPVGEWVALTGNTYYAHEVAHGVPMAVVSDELGLFGVTSTSQLLDPVDR